MAHSWLLATITLAVVVPGMLCVMCHLCDSDINCEGGGCEGTWCYKRRAPEGDKGYFRVRKGCSEDGYLGCRTLEGAGGRECFCDDTDRCNGATTTVALGGGALLMAAAAGAFVLLRDGAQ